MHPTRLRGPLHFPCLILPGDVEISNTVRGTVRKDMSDDQVARSKLTKSFVISNNRGIAAIAMCERVMGCNQFITAFQHEKREIAVARCLLGHFVVECPRSFIKNGTPGAALPATGLEVVKTLQ